MFNTLTDVHLSAAGWSRLKDDLASCGASPHDCALLTAWCAHSRAVCASAAHMTVQHDHLLACNVMMCTAEHPCACEIETQSWTYDTPALAVAHHVNDTRTVFSLMPTCPAVLMCTIPILTVVDALPCAYTAGALALAAGLAPPDQLHSPRTTQVHLLTSQPLANCACATLPVYRPTRLLLCACTSYEIWRPSTRAQAPA